MERDCSQQHVTVVPLVDLITVCVCVTHTILTTRVSYTEDETESVCSYTVKLCTRVLCMSSATLPWHQGESADRCRRARSCTYPSAVQTTRCCGWCTQGEHGNTCKKTQRLQLYLSEHNASPQSRYRAPTPAFFFFFLLSSLLLLLSFVVSRSKSRYAHYCHHVEGILKQARQKARKQESKEARLANIQRSPLVQAFEPS